MVRTQVYLTEEQDRGLKSLAESCGRKQSESIRAAIDRLLAESGPTDWKEALEAVRMRADRDDLDELHTDLRRGRRPGRPSGRPSQTTMSRLLLDTCINRAEARRVETLLDLLVAFAVDAEIARRAASSVVDSPAVIVPDRSPP